MNRPMALGQRFRVTAAALAVTLSAGCAGGQLGGARTTLVETAPPGASVIVEGYGRCTAPCTVEHDGVRRLTIAKAGYRKIEAEIEPGVGRALFTMELAAPSGDVEATELSPLQ